MAAVCRNQPKSPSRAAPLSKGDDGPSHEQVGSPAFIPRPEFTGAEGSLRDVLPCAASIRSRGRP
jgi:hypothetical protein